MSKGRHRKKTSNNLKRVAIGASVAVGGVSVPLTFVGTANAATVDDWDRVAQCESTGRWDLPYGDGGRSSGGLQFQPASWSDALSYLRAHGVDVSGYPQGPGHQAYKATKQQQIIAGEALLALQGPGAWTCNSKTGSPLNSGSMFKGGPAPFSATPAPAPVSASPPASEPEDAEDGVYVVKKGDYLAKIAADLKVEGGWQKLYEINKGVIGSDPNLIQVGMKLKLPGHEAPPAADPYKDGLPKADKSDPSAKPLQGELKRVNLLDKGIEANDNYGPATQAAVSYFHLHFPQFKSKGVHWQKDVQIGPKGWQHLRTMKPVDTAPPTTPPPPSSSGYVLPVQGQIGDGLIVGSGGSLSRSHGGHSGLDIIAPSGTPILAVTAGTVVDVNGNAGAAYGNYVTLKHSGGVYTLYAHMSAVSVSVGQSVSAGQKIGNVGTTGNSSGPHLHFEVRNHPTLFNSGVFSNPVTWLRSHGVTV